MKNIILFLFTSFCFLGVAHAEKLIINSKSVLPPAQLGISPPKITKEITGKKRHANQAITIFNYNKSPKKISLVLTDTDSNKKPIKPNDETLAPWTIIGPKQFTIPGGGKQIVRLSFRSPSHFPKKVHHAMIIIKQTPKAPKIKTSNGKQIATVSLGTSYGLPVTVNVK